VGAGHRHGHRERGLIGTFGPVTVRVPRARLEAPGGKTAEWKNATIANRLVQVLGPAPESHHEAGGEVSPPDEDRRQSRAGFAGAEAPEPLAASSGKGLAHRQGNSSVEVWRVACVLEDELAMRGQSQRRANTART
jgi:hypothetical protein